jgi:hypothetical protein
MNDHLFDGCGILVGFGQVEAGDLDAVEEQTGAFGMDAAIGDALQDFCDGGQDTAAVFDLGKARNQSSGCGGGLRPSGG